MDLDYFAINLAIGAGIAADAMVATLGRFHRMSCGADVLKWAAAVGLTHWLFPLVGFIGGWYLAVGAGLAFYVYALGAAVMFWYVASVLSNALRPTAEDSPERFWVAVFAVSIDALLTGPGKTAATARWSEAEVWLSFPLVGLVVFALVLGSACPAMILQARYAAGPPGGDGTGSIFQRATPDQVAVDDGTRLGVFFIVGVWAEVSIFLYFAWLAVVECLRTQAIHLDGGLVFLAAGLTAVAASAVFGRRVAKAQMAHARSKIAAARLAMQPG